MEAEDKKEDREDADAGKKLDMLLAHLDDLRGGMQSMHSRMDAIEASYKEHTNEEKEDAEEESEEKEDEDKAEEEHEEEGKEIKKLEKKAKEKKADAGKHPNRVHTPKHRMDEDKEEEKEDAEEEEEKEEKDERSDSALARRLADIERRIPKQMTDSDFAAMANAQARADTVAQAFGDAAPRPLQGESLPQYRRRLASVFKDKTKLKDVNLYSIKDETAFSFMEDQIYADAMAAALRPTDVPAGQLREIKTRDTAGRVVSTFVGEPRSWMQPHLGQRRRLIGIDKTGGQR